jgi:hypothetical protein
MRSAKQTKLAEFIVFAASKKQNENRSNGKNRENDQGKNHHRK